MSNMKNKVRRVYGINLSSREVACLESILNPSLYLNFNTEHLSKYATT